MIGCEVSVLCRAELKAWVGKTILDYLKTMVKPTLIMLCELFRNGDLQTGVYSSNSNFSFGHEI